MTVALEQLVRTVQVGAETIAGTLEPDGDWMPTLFAADAAGKLSIFAVPDFADNRQVFAEQLPGIVAESHAVVVAMVSTAWTAKADGTTRRPADRPDRAEAVVIAAADSQGRTVHCMAPVSRTPKSPPTLGAWDRPSGAVGLVVDLLRRSVM